MKIQLTKANAFQIEPSKKYLVLVTNKDNMMLQSEIDDINDTLRTRFGNNLTLLALPDGAKYKVVEQQNE